MKMKMAGKIFRKWLGKYSEGFIFFVLFPISAVNVSGLSERAQRFYSDVRQVKRYCNSDFLFQAFFLQKLFFSLIANER